MVRDASRTADFLGPFDLTLLLKERRVRLRFLQAVVRLCCGPLGANLCRLLALAEHQDEALEPAIRAIDHLGPLDFRRVLSTYAALHRAVLAA